MRHQRTRYLFDYWQSLRHGRQAPRRLDIDPIEIGRHLPYVFILERCNPRCCRFRLAGTYVCDCFGRELRGCEFAGLWRRGDRPTVDSVLRSITEACCCVVIEFVGQSRLQAERTTFEVLLLPLLTEAGRCDRVLGTLTALDRAGPHRHRGLEPLSLSSVQLIWAETVTAPSPAAGADLDRPAGFATAGERGPLRVIAGGRSIRARC